MSAAARLLVPFCEQSRTRCPLLAIKNGRCLKCVLLQNVGTRANKRMGDAPHKIHSELCSRPDDWRTRDPRRWKDSTPLRPYRHFFR